MHHRFSLRFLSVLLTLALVLSLFGASVFAATGTLSANTAVRHELCTQLSAQANAYYTGSYTYENLSQLSGPASSTDSYAAMQDNALYTALQTLMTSTHSVLPSYNPGGEKPNELSYLWDFTDCEYGHSEYTYFFTDIPADELSGDTMNREHVWPKSKASYYQKNGGTDLHHLRPSISSVNSAKSNRIFANVYGVASDCKTHEFNGETVLWLSASMDALEVKDEVKGDVARILLYIWCRWSQPNLYSNVSASLLPPMDSDDSANSGVRAIENKETLLQWMEMDPVDEWEMARNDQTENFQGNRNVFIDYPEFAWLVLGEELPTDMPTPSGEAQNSVIIPCEHTWDDGSVTTEPTCTEEGELTYTCTLCGETRTEEIPVTDHSWDDGTQTTPATCTEDGELTYTCTLCGETRTEEIPALGHSYETVVTAPTCTEGGFTTYACSACGDSYTADETEALGHSYTETVTEATCTEGGFTTYACSACGDSYVADETEALGHAWDEGAVTTEPTATETGVMTYTCTLCGETKTEEIPALGEDPDEPCDGGEDCPSAHFTDISAADWYHEAVDFAVENGLFGGMSANTFEPNTAMTRAMLVTVLWRYAGEPAEGENTFTDVPAGQWYTDAVAWAAHNNIVGGVGDNKFDPNGNVTREQMATILYRYANGQDIDTSARADLSGFPDAGSVSSYAQDPICWAVAEGLINGSDGKLLPQGNATRAQVATILMRFIENEVK